MTRFLARIAALGIDLNQFFVERHQDHARTHGIFGSPSFVVGRALFWGDDRLGDAVSWHRTGLVE